MICPPCRKQEHDGCPEKARQASGAPLPVDLLGGSLCDCQHKDLPGAV